MFRDARRSWLWTALAVNLLAGCQSGAVNSGYPSDPLLASRKPAEGAPAKEEQAVAQHSEPVPPTVPGSAVARGAHRPAGAKPAVKPEPPAAVPAGHSQPPVPRGDG